jgi:hypothetical protein
VIILTKPQLTHTISGSKHTGQLSNSQIPDYITRDSELSTVSGVLQSEIDTKSDLSHLHDDRYYTESEVDVISGALQSDIDSKAAAVHQHAESDITNLDKYTQAEVDAIVADINSDISTVSGIVITDHGALSGRGDDDHLQYHTDGRGDTRYYTKTLLNAGQLDNRYYTESEVDSALSNKSDVGHQHTESDVTNLDKYTQAEVDSLLTVLSGSLGSSNFQSFLDLTDTPSSYFPSQFAQSTGSGIIWTTISGLNGADGEDGYSWTTGSGVPDDDSENEDFWFYLDNNNWDIYRKNIPEYAPNNRGNDIVSCTSNGSNCEYTYDGVLGNYVYYSSLGNLYVTYDFGANYAHVINKIRIEAISLGFGGVGIAQFDLHGSNDDSSFTLLCHGNVTNTEGLHTFEFDNEVAYRYLKITVTSSYALGESAFGNVYFSTRTGYTWGLLGNIKGAAGVNGVDGADGADGVDGVDGADGADAPSEFINLTDTPSSYSSGKFAQSTGSGIVWSTISGLEGTDGTDGTDGYSWTTGSGVPDDDSENEDFWFYLDEDSWDVYCKDEPVFAPNNRDDDIISCSSNGSGCVNTYDGSTSTYVYSMGGGLYVTYDFGSGYTHAICRLRIYAGDLGFGLGIADFEFSGSNNNVDFDTIYSGHVPNSAGWHTFDFTNETAYRYLKITITSSYALGEFGFHSIALHSLSGYDWRLVGNIKGAAGANGVDGADGADGIDAPDTFLGLTDTPSSYSSGKFAQSTGSGIQWAEVQAAGDYITESEFSTYSGTLQSQIDSKADTAHSHNDLYYTESEVDTISGALNVAKSDIGHTHDDRYYTEDEIGDQWNLFQQYVIMGIETKADLEHTHTEVDVTNLDKYTQAEVDSLLTALSGSLGSSNAQSFLDLTDTPTTYSGGYDKFVKVTTSGIQFTKAVLDNLTDVADIPAPSAGQVLKHKDDGSGYEWTDQPSGQVWYYRHDLNLINPDAETGDLTGWTNEVGAMITSTGDAHSGTYKFHGGTVADSTARQNVSLLYNGLDATMIDQGLCILYMDAWVSSWSGDTDYVRFGFRFKDAGGSQINSTEYSPTHNYDSWTFKSWSVNVPVNTRSVDVLMIFHRYQGTSNNAYVDDIELYVKAPAQKLETLVDIPTPIADRYLKRKVDDSGYEWAAVSGTQSFLDLTDTPASYSGTSGKFAQSTGSGIQWAEVQAAGDYITESEFTVYSGTLQTQIDGKSDTSHAHDSRYYTESEVDTISGTLNSKINVANSFLGGIGQQSIKVEWASASSLTIGAGMVHINSGGDQWYTVHSALTFSPDPLTSSTWFYVYVDPPDDGYTLSVDDFVHSTLAPTKNAVKRGYYHPTNTDQRCIGYFYSDGSSDVYPFATNDDFFKMDLGLGGEYPGTFTGSWQDLSLTYALPGIEQEVLLYFEFWGTDSDAGMLRVRGKNTTEVDAIAGTVDVSEDQKLSNLIWVTSNGDGIQLDSGGASSTVSYYVALQAIKIPQMIYTGPANLASPMAESTFKAYEVVGEWELSAETADITIANVNGDTDDRWVVEWNYTSTTTADITIEEINGDTGNNYLTGYLTENNDAPTALYAEQSQTTKVTLTSTGANDSTNFGKAEIAFKSGVQRSFISHAVVNNTTDATYHYVSYFGKWTNTADEVTTFKIISDAAITGTIRAYKLKRVALPEAVDRSFLDLTDTPASYSGTSGKFAQSTGSGIQWAEVQAAGDYITESEFTVYSGTLQTQIDNHYHDDRYYTESEVDALISSVSGTGGSSSGTTNYSTLGGQGIQSIRVLYKDADEITLKPGHVHINDGSSDTIYTITDELDKQVTSLSTSTWYYVYVDPPESGLTLAAADIEYSSTAPTLDEAKKGYYHPSNTGQRCIGFFYSNDSGEVKHFDLLDDYIQIALGPVGYNYSFSSTTSFQDLTVGENLPALEHVAEINARTWGVDSDAGFLHIRGNGYSSSGIRSTVIDASYAGTELVAGPVINDGTGFEAKTDATGSISVQLWCTGLYLPKQIYTGPVTQLSSSLAQTNFSAYELVAEYNLDNETLNETITNVQGDTYDRWYIEYNFEADSTSYLGLTLNNDTNTNYYRSQIVENNDAIAANYDDSRSFALLTHASESVSGWTNLFLKSGKEREIHAQFLVSDTGATSRGGLERTWWSNENDEVTSIELDTSAAITGYIRVYKFKRIYLPDSMDPNKTFLSLTDTPSTYSGTSGKFAQSTGSGIQWAEVQAAGDYITESEFTVYSGTLQTQINGKQDSGNYVTDSEFATYSGTLQTQIDNHYHDDRYYTESEIDALFTAISGSVESGFEAYELVAEYNLSDETLNETLSGLTGDTDKLWKIEAHFANTDTSSMEFGVQLNGDTDNNYNFSYWGTGNAGTAVNGEDDSHDSMLLASQDVGDDTSLIATLFLKSGLTRKAISERTNQDDTVKLASRWTNTADEVTSMRIFTDYDVTGYVRVYKLNQVYLPSSSSSATTFLELTDTPTSYSGTSGYYAQSTGSGIQWAEVQAAGDYVTDSEFSTYSGTLQTQIDSKSDTDHIHDDRYYTESEVDTISGTLNSKINVANSFLGGIGQQSIKVEWASASSLTIGAGMVHINDNGDSFYTVPEAFEVIVSGLEASTWYYVYVDPPVSGYTLSSDDIEYSTTAPTKNASKRGYYHGTNTDWRCIGAFYSAGSSNVYKFYVSGLKVLYDDDIATATDNTPSGSWTDQNIVVPLIGDNPIAVLQFNPVYYSSSTSYRYRTNGSSSSGIYLGTVGSGPPFDAVYREVVCDSSGIIETKFDASTTNHLDIAAIGFVYPDGIYTGPANLASPMAESTFKAYEVVGEWELSAETADITINNVNGDTDDRWVIEYNLLAGGTAATLSLKYNNTSGSEYVNGYIFETNDAISGLNDESATTSMAIGYASASTGTAGKVDLFLKSGDKREILGHANRTTSVDESTHHVLYSSHWTDTSTEVSVINIDTDQAVTGTIRIYKLKRVALPEAVDRSLLDLTDTPTTYSGSEDKYLKVTSSGIEFAEVLAGGGTSDVDSFLDLSDTPTTYSETSGYFVKSTGSGTEWSTISDNDFTLGTSNTNPSDILMYQEGNIKMADGASGSQRIWFHQNNRLIFECSSIAIFEASYDWNLGSAVFEANHQRRSDTDVVFRSGVDGVSGYSFMFDSTNGYVGLGVVQDTTAGDLPSERLHINGNIKIDSGNLEVEFISEPSNPSEGYGVVWTTDGDVGSGNEGDLMFKSTVSGTTTTYNLTNINNNHTHNVEVFKTTDYYASVNDIVYVDTTISGFTTYLPTNADQFDKVTVKDVGGSMSSNNLIIDPSSGKIRGDTDDLAIDTNYVKLEFVYINSSIGWSY